MAKLKTFNVVELQLSGFRGFIPFAELRQQHSQGDNGVPQSPGAYIVMRASTDAPEFLAKGYGGTHKANSPNSPISVLESKWVNGASVIYIGRASQRKDGGGLWDRINEYATAGKGLKHRHQGGEYIWQLADARQLLVAWKVAPPKTERMLESSLLDAFQERYGKLPFANRRHE